MNKKMIGYLITALVIGAMIVVVVKSNLDKPEAIDVNPDAFTADVGLDRGNLPPDFELETMTGEVIKLSDYKGKKVMLNFWASWCGPCKAEMPHMQNYYKNNKDDANIEIIAVNLTQAERKGLGGVEQFIDAHGLTFPIPLDKDGAIMDQYRVISIPTTYLLNTDGTIAQTFTAPVDEKTLAELIDQLN